MSSSSATPSIPDDDFRLQRFATVIDAASRSVNIVIVCATVFGIALGCVRPVLIAYAGKTTVVGWMFHWTIGYIAGGATSGAATIWALVERRLRKRSEKRHLQRNRQLELEIARLKK